jgi:hypothetical protein
MSLEPGAQVGPYEIQALIASSAMGEVYRARDRRLGREVALKKLPAGARSDPEHVQRFETEARAASALNHPNILAVFDVGVHDGAPFVVSELLDGQTLRDRLAGGALSTRKAIEHARQLARGLAAAHDRGIVHRDLKPENVFVTRDGYVKILDFGLARLVGDEGPVPPDDAATQGRVLGTVGYMAPEQVRGEAADARADIFAFGAVLYEMLSGRRAFKAATSVETLTAILKEEPPPLGSDLAGSALERLVWHCLEKAPQDRFQSARDLAFDLDSLGSVSLPGVPAAGRTAGRGLGRLALAAGAGAILAALVAYLARPSPEAAPAYERLTFRRGTIESARFAPDGHAVVYGAAWGGAPVAVFGGRLGSPESRPLGFTATELLAVSSRGEMALSLQRRRIGTFVGAGILARAPLAGGAPREILEDVQWADWAPDGDGLAIVRSVGGRNRLEFPVGRILHETAGWISHPRFSASGSSIAFLDHPVWGDDGGNVAIVDLPGGLRTLSRNWGTLQGLAWSPRGELLFSGSRVGGARAIHAVDLDGRERLVVRMPGVLTIHDVNADGRMLLSHHSQRRELAGRPPGAAEDIELSWLDYSFASDLTEDGRSVFFAENGEGGGPGYSVYVRGLDGAAAVRLGEGAAMALSPDGRFALANRDYTTDAPQLVLIPTGAGEPRLLPRGGVNTQAASFFPDGRRVLLAASAQGAATRVYVQELDKGEPRPITPEGVRFALSTRPLSPDGRLALLQDAEGRHRLYPVEGGDSRVVAGLDASEQPLRFSRDGRHVFFYQPGQIPARVMRLDLEDGGREPWLELAPGDRSGVLAVNPVLLTSDGRGYVYGYRRVLSELYSVTGLR